MNLLCSKIDSIFLKKYFLKSALITFSITLLRVVPEVIEKDGYFLFSIVFNFSKSFSVREEKKSKSLEKSTWSSEVNLMMVKTSSLVLINKLL